MKQKIISSVCLALTFLFLFSCLAACTKNPETDPTKPQTPAAEEKTEAGYQAPDFEASLITGEKFILSEQTGKTVVLNFWATWCGYCVEEMPYFEELSKEYGDSVLFIGVNTGESLEEINTFLDEEGFTYGIIPDPDETISAKYPTDAIPLTVIIKPDGTVAETVLGAREKEVWKEKIDAAMNG